MDDFFKQYLITALWSSNDDNGEPFDSNYEIEDISEESLEKAKKDCEEFQRKAGSLLDDYELSTCGHDFWLTRNGHGAGFWDGDYEEGDGKKLTELSKEFNELNLFKGDDNKIYFE